MNRILCCCYLFLLFASHPVAGQTANTQKRLFDLSAGFGSAGSFFVRSYSENEVSSQTSFLKKNFLGKTWHIELSRPLGSRFEIAAGYSFQEFKKKAQYKDNLVQLDHTIHHINHIGDISARRKFDRRRHMVMAGLGIYYIRPVQEEITISRSGAVLIQDRNYKNSNLEEAGALAEGTYEYKFESRVHLGIRCRFFYTVSAGEAESIALYPYIRLQL